MNDGLRARQPPPTFNAPMVMSSLIVCGVKFARRIKPIVTRGGSVMSIVTVAYVCARGLRLSEMRAEYCAPACAFCGAAPLCTMVMTSPPLCGKSKAKNDGRVPVQSMFVYGGKPPAIVM